MSEAKENVDKRGSDSDIDEGFDSIGQECLPTQLQNSTEATQTQTDGSENFNSNIHSDDGYCEDTGVMDYLNAHLSLHNFSILSRGTREVSTQTAKDPLNLISEEMAHDIVFYLLGKNKFKPRNTICETMRRCVDKLLDKHEINFNGMIQRLQVTDETVCEALATVSNVMFEDNIVNWGRIVGLYAFSGRLAQYCVENDMEIFSIHIVQFLGQYVGEKFGEFIKENGGWVSIKLF